MHTNANTMRRRWLAHTNARAGVAVAGVRIDRNAATMSELYDALNERRDARDVTNAIIAGTYEQSANERNLRRDYLRRNAPDLIGHALA